MNSNALESLIVPAVRGLFLCFMLLAAARGLARMVGSIAASARHPDGSADAPGFGSAAEAPSDRLAPDEALSVVVGLRRCLKSPGLAPEPKAQVPVPVGTLGPLARGTGTDRGRSEPVPDPLRALRTAFCSPHSFLSAAYSSGARTFTPAASASIVTGPRAGKRQHAG